MESKRSLTIFFMDGTKVDYEFPRQHGDKISLASHVNTMLEMQYIIIESDGCIHFYPVCNIKSIQVYPISKDFPDNIVQIKGAESIPR